MIRKFMVAVLGAAALAAAAALTDNQITTTETVQIVIAVATAIQVWVAANTPELTWAKAATALVLGAANVAVGLIFDGLDAADVSAIIVGALTAAGVYAIRNTDRDPSPPVDAPAL